MNSKTISNLKWSFQYHLREWGIRKKLLLTAIEHFPKFAYLFSERKKFPNPSQRIPKTANPSDDFTLLEGEGAIPQVPSATILLRGRSFDSQLIANLPGPIFAVNWPNKINRDDVYYVSSDQNDFCKMDAQGCMPLIFIQGIYHDKNGVPQNTGLREGVQKALKNPANKHIVFSQNFNIPNTAIGSAVACAMVLFKKIKSLKIYGWDQYLPKDLASSTYQQTLDALDSFSEDWVPPDIIEMSALNWLYAYRLHQFNTVQIQGHIAETFCHSQIFKKLEQIAYKNE